MALVEAKKGWFYEMKLLFSSEARIARRKKLNEEVTRGRFWELNQIRDNGGKLFESDQELIPAKEAIPVPDLSGYMLNGKEKKLSDVLGGKTSIVTVCVRDMARPMIRGWVDPVIEKFGTNPHVQVTPPPPHPTPPGTPVFKCSSLIYLRLIYSCITQLKSQGPSRTCTESKEEEEEQAHTMSPTTQMHIGLKGYDSGLVLKKGS